MSPNLGCSKEVVPSIKVKWIPAVLNIKSLKKKKIFIYFISGAYMTDLGIANCNSLFLC